MKNIVLTGFMGTGKSSVGRLLARDLSMTFLDLDDLIEREAGMPIKEIFSNFGEARFRELEKEAIGRVVSGEFGGGMVLATGGGAVVDAESRALLKNWGALVCLCASVETILDRTARTVDRPLLERGDREAEVRRLLQEREDAYKDCEMILDTTKDSITDVVRKIKIFMEKLD